MNEKRENVLAQLKYPLVFFGLALLLMEGIFSACLVAKSDSVLLLVVLVSWMSIMFLITILVVAFLVWKVPTHIMLQAQSRVDQEVTGLIIRRSQLEQTVAVLQDLLNDPPSDSHSVEMALDILRGALRDEMGQVRYSRNQK